MNVTRSPRGTSKKTPASSLARSSAVMFTGTLASRILGVVRNALLVLAVGATNSGAADAFTTANNAPTMIYNLLAAGVLNAILVPQIVRALRQRDGEEIVNRLLTAAATVLFGATVLITVVAPLVVTIYAADIGPARPLAIAFAFWCLPQIFFYGLYALWGQVLNAKSSFGPYMWTPVLNNVISIASLLVYLKLFGHYTAGDSVENWSGERIALLGASATVGIAAQAVILVFPLLRSGFKPRFIWGVRGIGLGHMSKVALWALIGLIVSETGTLAIYNLGSAAVHAASRPEYVNQVVPSLTLFTNAQMIFILPQSLVTTSIVVALFTRMSEKAAAGNSAGVRDDLSLGLRSIAVFNVLFTAGIAVLAAPALVLFVPSLSNTQAEAGGILLVILALGIVPQGIWSATQRVMLAYEDTKRLLRADIPVGLVPIVISIIAYLMAPPTQWMIWAAIGSTSSQFVGAIIILFLQRKHLPGLDAARIVRVYLLLVIAVIPAVGVGLGIIHLVGSATVVTTSSRFTHALMEIIVVAIGMSLTYVTVARALRVAEVSAMLRPLRRIVIPLAKRLPDRAARALRRFFMIPDDVTATLVTSPVRRLTPAPYPRSVPSRRMLQENTEVIPVVRAQLLDSLPASLPPGARIRTDRQDLARGAHAPIIVGGRIPTSKSTTTRNAVPRVDSMGRAISSPTQTSGRRTVVSSTPIGSGRYHMLDTLPTTLPRIIRHRGKDTILDRDVTILTLTDSTPNREDVLEAASRAVLVDDPRLVRVLEVDPTSKPAFIVIEDVAGRTYESLVTDGLKPEQVRSIIGEVAQALSAGSRKGLNHLHLSPTSIRILPDGGVKVLGLGIEAALNPCAIDETDSHAEDRIDGRDLVQLLYYGLTRRWPGKRTGIPSAPMRDGVPVLPSLLADGVPKDLDELCAATWAGKNAPSSASTVARALGQWQPIEPLMTTSPARNAFMSVKVTQSAQKASTKNTAGTHGSGTGTATGTGAPPPSVTNTRAHGATSALNKVESPDFTHDSAALSNAAAVGRDVGGDDGAADSSAVVVGRDGGGAGSEPIIAAGAGTAQVAGVGARALATISGAFTSVLAAAAAAGAAASSGVTSLVGAVSQGISSLKSRPAPRKPAQIEAAPPPPMDGSTETPVEIPAQDSIEGVADSAQAQLSPTVEVAPRKDRTSDRGTDLTDNRVETIHADEPGVNSRVDSDAIDTIAAATEAARAAELAKAADISSTSAAVPAAITNAANDFVVESPGSAPSIAEAALPPAHEDAHGTKNVDDENAALTPESFSAVLKRNTSSGTVVLTTMLLVIVVAIYFAVSNLIQLSDVQISDPDVPAAQTVPTLVSTSPAASGQRATTATITAVTALDPFGDDNEHPDLANLAHDGNSDTMWYSRYYTNSSLSFKGGIGLAITLEGSPTVSQITLDGTGNGGNVQVRDTSADAASGGPVLAEGPFTSGTTTFTFDPTQTNSIVLWVTDLPTSSDGLFKVTVSEITVK